MNNKSLTAAVVAVVLIGLGVIVLTQNNKNQQSLNGPVNEPAASQRTDSQPQPNTVNEPAQQQTPQSDNTITYTNGGFSQSTITVKAGSAVTIKNDSSRVLQFDSDPHPQHTDNPELNIGNVAPGQSKSFTVTKTGTHGFHNHANASHNGLLVVE